MIIHDIEQRSDEWKQLRCGIPTASEFSRIITPKGKISSQYNDYLDLLLTERLLGKPIQKWDGNEHTENGKELEGIAVKAYELLCDAECVEVGFITDNKKRYGCSPDRLVGENGGLEIKCPTSWKHVANLWADEVPEKYIPQIQGNIFVSEREWWDWMSFHPDLEPLIIRVYRDDGYCKTLDMLLRSFCENLEIRVSKMVERGYDMQAL